MRNQLYHCQGGNTTSAFMVKERTSTEKQGRTTNESQKNRGEDGKKPSKVTSFSTEAGMTPPPQRC